nr:hypothetical protein [uncultured Roseateles sp.]
MPQDKSYQQFWARTLHLQKELGLQSAPQTPAAARVARASQSVNAVHGGNVFFLGDVTESTALNIIAQARRANPEEGHHG